MKIPNAMPKFGMAHNHLKQFETNSHQPSRMAATDGERFSPAGGKKPLFMMEIVDGFTFRGLIEILHNLNTEGIFVYDRHKCVYVNSDDKRNIIVKISIEKRLMISYKYAPEKEDEIVSVYVPMAKFKDALKSVTKRDNLMLYQYYGDSNLYIGRTDNEDEQYITTLEGGMIPTFSEPTYKAGINSPSYVIGTEELSRKFSTIGRGGTNSVEGHTTIIDDGDSLRVNVEGPQGSGSRVKISKTQSDAPRLGTPQIFQLTKGIVKLLSKIQALYKGPAQFYTEEGRPLKITCNVGTYGNLVAYISNITEVWEVRQREERELKPVPVAMPKLPEPTAQRFAPDDRKAIGQRLAPDDRKAIGQRPHSPEVQEDKKEKTSVSRRPAKRKPKI